MTTLNINLLILFGFMINRQKMKPIYLFFIIGISCSSLLGQEQNTKPLSRVGLTIGLDFLSTSNRHLAPVNFSGSLANFGLNYQRQSAHSHFSTNLSLTTGDMSHEIIEFTPVYTEFDFELAYAYRIFEGKKWKNYLGAGLSFNTWFMQYNFADIADVISIIPSQNFDLHNVFVYEVNAKSKLQWIFNFGLFSKAYLQPYASYNEEWIADLESNKFLFGGDFYSVGTILRWKSAIQYTFQLSKRLDMTSELVNRFYGVKTVKAIRIQSTAVKLTLNVKLGKK